MSYHIEDRFAGIEKRVMIQADQIREIQKNVEYNNAQLFEMRLRLGEEPSLDKKQTDFVYEQKRQGLGITALAKDVSDVQAKLHDIRTMVDAHTPTILEHSQRLEGVAPTKGRLSVFEQRLDEHSLHVRVLADDTRAHVDRVNRLAVAMERYAKWNNYSFWITFALSAAQVAVIIHYFSTKH